MPPNGYSSVSIDAEACALLDRVIDASDAESRAAAIEVAAEAYLDAEAGV